jgi:hypothetical protein
MGNAADWIEDSHNRLYYGGTMPETYLDDDDASTTADRLDEDAPLGYEAAQPALQQALATWQAVL